MTGYNDDLSRRVMLLDFDPGTGKIWLDMAFGEGEGNGSGFMPGVMIDRESWPHGPSGPATAHGAIFWPPATPDWKNRD